MRQTQQYCGGDFITWDPMITTFPGLYFAAVGLLQPASAALGEPLTASSWLCSPPVLRLINPLFGLLAFFCCADILEIIAAASQRAPQRQQQPAYDQFKQLKASRGGVGAAIGRTSSKASPSPKRPATVAEPGATAAAGTAATWGALTLSLCPLHFFFAFLFYTDLGGAILRILIETAEFSHCFLVKKWPFPETPAAPTPQNAPLSLAGCF